MQTIDFKINSITFTNGIRLSIENGSIVVVVGPNNSGKTTILSEIRGKLTNPNGTALNIAEIETPFQEVNSEHLEHHFVEVLNLKKIPSYGSSYDYKGFEIDISTYFRENKTKMQGKILSAFVLFVDTITRLRIIEPTSSISLSKDAYTHPFHYLLSDENMERQLSQDVSEAFNFETFLHPFAGPKVYLLIGKRPDINGNERRLELAKTYDSFPELIDQGDGVKAYIGVLLTLTAAVQKILLVDEPENFLHPPQANKLGRLIGHYSSTTEKEIFISTHSSDLLKGILETSDSKLQILRTTKDHSLNLLDNKLCKEIWNADPIIKSSNLLDGLFHDTVIICESDSDVKFYSFILDQITENNKDILFVASYGKEKMLKMHTALRKLDIDNKCILDFDVLSDKDFIQNLFNSIGVDFRSLRSSYEPLYAFLKERNREDVKRAGKQIINSSNQSHYDKLNAILRDQGIFLVEVGELERFVKSKEGKSSKWIIEVMKDANGLFLRHELDDAINFLKSVLSI